MNLTKKSNTQMSEKEYRDIKGSLNYSAIRVYLSSRTKFYKQFILNEVQEDEQSAESIIGSIAHVKMADREGEFDSKYVLASAKEPTGQMMTLVQNLYKIARRSMTAELVQTREFEQLFLDAVQETKYGANLEVIAFKGKELPKILEMFTETDKNGCCPEKYYQELLNHTGKQVVTISQITGAERAVEILKNHQYTRDIVAIQTGGDIEVWNELPILWKWRHVPCKSMIDKLVIDHQKKTVSIYDWKFTWDENFTYSYIKNKYWLQVGMYHMAVLHWMLEEHSMKDYTLNPMCYVICDPVGNSAPLVYQLTNKDTMAAVHGFTVRGIKYPGVEEVLEDIDYHVESAVWNSPVQAQKNNGQMSINIQYENQ